MARVSRADVNMPDYNGFPLASSQEISVGDKSCFLTCQRVIPSLV